jgi:microcystin-dependent protein
MSENYIGEIRMFGGTFEPMGWAFCDGRSLPIQNNQALFSVLGTYYGGNGTTNFNLPDLRGRIPLHRGPGVGVIGTALGSEQVALTQAHMMHTHGLHATSDSAGVNDATNNLVAAITGTAKVYQTNTATLVDMNAGSVTTAGGTGAPHNNVMPSLGINFIIATAGIFPSRG